MVPRTVGSADDRNLAMLADGTFFPGFRLIELRPDRCTPGSRVLAYVSHGRGGIDDKITCVVVARGRGSGASLHEHQQGASAARR